MAKETKVGMLVGMGIILLIAWVVGDHLSVVSQQSAPDLTEFADQSGQSLVNRVTPDLTTPRQPGAGGQPFTPVEQSPAPAPPSPNPPVHNDAPDPGANPLAGDTGHDTADAPDDNHAIPTADEAEQQLQPPPAGGQDHARIAGGIEAWRVSDIDDDGRGSADARQHERRDALRDDLPGRRLGPRPQRVFHVVQQGEAIWAIAQHYGGNGSRWPLIRDANPTAVAEDGTVRAGVRLIIPVALLVDEQEAATPNPDNLPPDEAVADVRRGLESQQRGPVRLPADAVRVKQGDTLGHLALDHLGSSRLWPKLLEANRDQLSRPEDLRVGMVLQLPQIDHAPRTDRAGRAESQRREPTATPHPRPSNRPRGKTYHVKAGQTLRSIAGDVFGDKARWKEIYRANIEQIDDPDRVEAGLTLVIP